MSNLYADEEQQPPVDIPYRELSPDALQGVIESFVLQEGTEYGWRDFSLEEKVAHVTRQLERGEARIVFDPNTETVGIVSAEPKQGFAKRADDQSTR
jgi:uncharacterized protein YheU (UPF0270 family)